MEAQARHQRLRRDLVAQRRAHLRDREVPRGRLDRRRAVHRPRADARSGSTSSTRRSDRAGGERPERGGRPDAAPPRRARVRRPPRPRHRPSPAVRPHAQPRRAAGGPLRARQRRRRRSSRTSGASSASPASRSTSSSARTGDSPGRRWSSSPRWRPTARPRSAVLLPHRVFEGFGSGSCTTAPRTTSPPSSTSCRTSTPRSCRSSSASAEGSSCPGRREASSGPHAMHDAEYGTIESSRGAREAGAQDRRRARRHLAEPFTVRALRRGSADREPALPPAGPRRRADQDRPGAATRRRLVPRVHHRGRDRPAAARVPGPPARAPASSREPASLSRAWWRLAGAAS